MNRLSSRVNTLEEKTGKGQMLMCAVILHDGETPEAGKQRYLAERGGREEDCRWIFVEFVSP